MGRRAVLEVLEELALRVALGLAAEIGVLAVEAGLVRDVRGDRVPFGVERLHRHRVPTHRIEPPDGVRPVGVEVQPSLDSDGIRRDVLAGVGVVVAEAVGFSSHSAS
jgi:hypothetical protein